MPNKISNKKTYLVVGLFIIIILICMYIVISKAVIKTKENNINKELEQENKTILKGSNVVTELSLKNTKVEQLYNYVNNSDIEYILYENRKDISWEIKSFVVVMNLQNNLLEDNEISYVAIDDFNNLYNKIFGDINEIKFENRISRICNGASLNKELNRYEINNDCSNNNGLNMKTYLKNITVEDEIISINKYYSFVNYTINGEDIYYKNELSDRYLIANNISYRDEANYINKMNIISYKFKKNSFSNYLLYKVEIGGLYE
ncbi:MAG: hypothetical protein PUD59_04415 [bacterium]|nr:hypothetical protein [bacterium]